MGYIHIENLYKDQTILLFKECYALEKIHGRSAHVQYKDDGIIFFSGGCKYEEFIKLFNVEDLLKKFREFFHEDSNIIIYGEAYGGKYQGMARTYGKDLRFVVFEVKIDRMWLPVPKAENVAKLLGFDFVPYEEIDVTLEEINKQRDADSVQAIKNGMGEGHIREGIVLRPLEEFTKNNGDRVIVKHKRDEFKETATPRKITDKLEKLLEVNKIIDEWLTEARLDHVLNKAGMELEIRNISKIITCMQEDIYREAKGEIEESKELKKAIGRGTALMFKKRLNVIK